MRAHTLFAVLLREEWRLHARLFGGARFAPFPLLVLALTASATWALTATGTPPADVTTGLHVLALAFGLYTGTAGFAGTDLLESVLGDVTLVLSSSTTLPLSRRRLLGAFLVKDAAFYAVVFLLPMALSRLPLVATGAVGPLDPLAVWLSLSVTFAAGTVVTFGLVALRTRAVGTVGMFAVASGVVGLWAVGLWPTLWDLLVVVDDPLAVAVVTALGVVVAGGATLAVFDPTYRRPARTSSGAFGALLARVGDDTGLVTKTLLDLQRSTGGLAKPFVSTALLAALGWFLLGVVERVAGIAPDPGVFFGTLLGLGAFTTYNWLTQFDRVEEYRALPLTVGDVFRAKRRAFALVGTPAALLAYLLALALVDVQPVGALAGGVLLGGLSVYFYGVTTLVAGFEPNEHLFDTVRFVAFTAGVALPAVPLFIAGFAVDSGDPVVATGFVVVAVALAGVGVAFARRATVRWTAYYREHA